MGRSFPGELRAGTGGTGDRFVAHDAALVIEGERQWRETGVAETEDHVRAAMRGDAEEEESAAARSSDLAAIRAPIPRDLVPAVDFCRAHALRQTALELPAFV